VAILYYESELVDEYCRIDLFPGMKMINAANILIFGQIDLAASAPAFLAKYRLKRTGQPQVEAIVTEQSFILDLYH
jgi:hypothetical protein